MNASGWYTGAAVADVNGDGRPGRVRRRLLRPERPGPELARRLPDEPRRRPRPALPQRGQRRERPRAVPRGRRRRPGSSRPSRATGSAPCSRTTTATAAPTSTSRTTRIRTSSTRTFPGPGGAAADPAGLGFRFEERGAAEGVADPYRRHGHRDERRRERPSRPVRDQLAQRAVGGLPRTGGRGSPAFANARPTFDPALGSGFAGWGASWVDLRNTGSPRPRARRRRDPGDEALDTTPSRSACWPGRAGARRGSSATPRRARLGAGLRLNGRGLAAADVDNDGRMEIAINTIGGKLVLLRPTGAERPLARRAAVAVLARRASSRSSCRTGGGSSARCRQGAATSPPRIRACTSGSARRRAARLVTVRYPWGGESRSAGVKADQIVESPRRRPCHDDARPSTPYQLANCTPSGARRPLDRRALERGGGRRAPSGPRAPSRCRRATCSTSPPRCGTPGPRTTRRRAATS